MWQPEKKPEDFTESHILNLISEDQKLEPKHLFAVRKDGLTYAKCLIEAAGTMELVQQFDRLYGSTLAARKTPIDKMIDDSTGKTDHDMQAFMRFVWNSIFIRIQKLA